MEAKRVAQDNAWAVVVKGLGETEVGSKVQAMNLLKGLTGFADLELEDAVIEHRTTTYYRLG